MGLLFPHGLVTGQYRATRCQDIIDHQDIFPHNIGMSSEQFSDIFFPLCPRKLRLAFERPLFRKQMFLIGNASPLGNFHGKHRRQIHTSPYTSIIIGGNRSNVVDGVWNRLESFVQKLNQNLNAEAMMLELGLDQHFLEGLIIHTGGKDHTIRAVLKNCTFGLEKSVPTKHTKIGSCLRLVRFLASITMFWK
jgi:hypothetical protein